MNGTNVTTTVATVTGMSGDGRVEGYTDPFSVATPPSILQGPYWQHANILDGTDASKMPFPDNPTEVHKNWKKMVAEREQKAEDRKFPLDGNQIQTVFIVSVSLHRTLFWFSTCNLDMVVRFFLRMEV